MEWSKTKNGYQLKKYPFFYSEIKSRNHCRMLKDSFEDHEYKIHHVLAEVKQNVSTSIFFDCIKILQSKRFDEIKKLKWVSTYFQLYGNEHIYWWGTRNYKLKFDNDLLIDNIEIYALALLKKHAQRFVFEYNDIMF